MSQQTIRDDLQWSCLHDLAIENASSVAGIVRTLLSTVEAIANALEARVEIVSDALMELDAQSVSVEDADADTPAEAAAAAQALRARGVAPSRWWATRPGCAMP